MLRTEEDRPSSVHASPQVGKELRIPRDVAVNVTSPVVQSYGRVNV